MVFRFAIAEGLARRDPTVDLSHALAPAKPVEHMASLLDGELPTFFVRLRDYDGAEQTRVAIELVLHTMVRTGRPARSDLGRAGGATYGASRPQRMKMSLEHIVPLTPYVAAAVRAVADAQRWRPSGRSRRKARQADQPEHQ